MPRQLRMIKGGRSNPEVHQQQGLRLYRPYSTGDLKVGNTIYHDVRFNWYCLERAGPIGPFEDLISNYKHLEEKKRLVMEGEANRCLLGEEVDDLRWYLRHRYALNVVAEAVVLPMRERSHLIGENQNVVYDFLQLTENTGYSLLFKAWGYYTTLHCLTSPSLESGVSFLTKALQWLRPGSAAGEADIERVVKRLYQEEGLYVERSSEEVQSS
jgi:hypothetical protein